MPNPVTNSTTKNSRGIGKEVGTQSGGHFDFELKRKHNRDLATVCREAGPELAQESGLPRCAGTSPVPMSESRRKPRGEMRAGTELVTETLHAAAAGDK